MPVGVKRLDDRARQQGGKTMKIIINKDIEAHSEAELAGLFRVLSQKLVSTERGSPERRNLLASLETVQRKRNAPFFAPGF